VFKGKNVTLEMVDVMSDADVEELNSRVEARLGAVMSKSLGSSLLHCLGATTNTGRREKRFSQRVGRRPVRLTWLQATCCELYYRYGMYLAPLSETVITAKHCNWQLMKSSDERVGQPDENVAYLGDDSYQAAPEAPATN
jgi:hypothetical protein